MWGTNAERSRAILQENLLRNWHSDVAFPSKSMMRESLKGDPDSSLVLLGPERWLEPWWLPFTRCRGDRKQVTDCHARGNVRRPRRSA